MRRLAHRALAGALSCASSLGCAPSPRSIELPADADARAQLVAIARDRQGLELRATDYGAPLRVDLGEDGRADVELLLYDEPLAALALEAGPVEPAGNAPLTRPLPEPRSTYRLAIGGDERWSLAPGPSDALAAVRIARARRCGLPTVMGRVQLSDVGRSAWMARGEGDQVELLSNDGELRVVGPSGVAHSMKVTVTSTLGSGGEGFAPHNAARAEDGSLWVSSRRTLWRVSPGPAPRATPVRTDPRWSSLQATAIDPRDPEGELYVADADGIVDRLSRGTLTRLFDARAGSISNIVSIIRWGPGELTVAFSGRVELVNIKGEAVLLDYPFDPREQTTFAHRTGERTLVVSSPSGLVREGTLGPEGRFAWREVGRAPIVLGWNAVATRARGFLYGTENGWVGEWRDGEFCDPPLGPVYVDRVTTIVALDTLLAVSGIGAGARSNEVAFLKWP